RLRHRIRPVKSALRHELAQLAQERFGSVTELLGQFSALRSIWVEPILRKLGYSVREAEASELQAAPPATTAVLLDALDREGDGVVRRSERVMVLFGPGADPNATGDGSVREYARQLCADGAVDEAILTDGILWIRYMVKRKLQTSARNLPDLLAR